MADVLAFGDALRIVAADHTGHRLIAPAAACKVMREPRGGDAVIATDIGGVARTAAGVAS